jgi:transposase-like protein
MNCPYCASNHIRKNGHRRGKQNYICVDCERQFIESYSKRGYNDEIKRLVAKRIPLSKSGLAKAGTAIPIANKLSNVSLRLDLKKVMISFPWK